MSDVYPGGDGAGVVTFDGEKRDDGSYAAVAKALEYLPPSQCAPGRQYDILSRWCRADMDFSEPWRARAEFEFAFRAGEQWTAEDKAILDEQRRPHIVFNRVLTILKAVAGMEINGRHEIHFIPRNTEDTKVNEVLSGASKWMADTCDAEDEESQAFDNCCTCGMGWAENRMAYDDDPSGLYVEESVNPREMVWDRTARKKNLTDARRIFRVRKMACGDAMRLFPGFSKDQLNATWAVSGGTDYPQKTLEQKRKRDTDNTDLEQYDDLQEVTIVQAQWIEHETYYLLADPLTGERVELSEQKYKVLEARMKRLGIPLLSARLERKVYKQAFLGAENCMLKPAGPSPIAGQFSWKCITGELDQSTGHWFGLVKVMRDPQIWANKWLSQILHILNTTAKGGIIAERDAFDDEREAEEGYAQPDAITWAASGALSGQNPKIIPKPGQAISDGYVGLLTFAVSSIKDVVGVNLELLGQQDMNQPGVVEMMRKQAGMTVLATLFDSLRRFRKQTGRARLYFIQNFLSDGRLIRIVGPEGAETVRLAREKTTGEYDVVVDDAPTSPNQKEATWAILQPLLGVFKDQLLANPKVLTLVLEYSPLPSRVVEAVKGLIEQQQNDPQVQQQAQENRQLFVMDATATIEKNKSAAALNYKKAESTETDALYNITMAKNLLADNKRAELAGLFDVMEGQARLAKSNADAEKARAGVERERAKVGADMADAETRRMQAATEARKAASGNFIEHLATMSKVRRETAAAQKDLALARKADREPAKPTSGSK
jgi:hypothetical protein